MKMHYSRNVKAQMQHRKPRKKLTIKKSTIDEFIIFNLWFFGFIGILLIGFTM